MQPFWKKKSKKPVKLPKVLMAEEIDPVNYNSVLDYLTGLSRQDYDKLIKVSGIYRDADSEAAKILKVKNEATTELLKDKPSDEEVDAAMDLVITSSTEFIDDGPEAPKRKKVQSTKPKKVEKKS